MGTMLPGFRMGSIITSLSALLLSTYSARTQFAFTTNADGSLNVSDYTNSPGTGGTIIIPDTTNGLRITSIGVSAFFLGTTLTNVIMGTNITSIGAQAFSGCFGLASVTMPEGVTNIGLACFNGCISLTNVTIPGSLTSIAYELFEGCTSLTSITLPNSVTYIAGLAFQGCTSLTNVTMPFGVTNIDPGAFQQSGLVTVVIPDSVTAIGTDAFDGCRSLTSVTIPNSVTSIGQGAFYDCFSLITVTIPDGVTSLLPNTFAYCTNLTSVTIGTGVTNIAGNMFDFCGNLRSVYFRGNAPTVGILVGALAIAYYLPGTTGWGPSFGTFWPTALWNPQPQTGSASFGVGTNGFGFTIIGSRYLVIVVEAATNLANPAWLPLSTNALTTFVGSNGMSYFSDPQWTNHSSRFYRIRSP